MPNENENNFTSGSTELTNKRAYGRGTAALKARQFTKTEQIARTKVDPKTGEPVGVVDIGARFKELGLGAMQDK
ncbi:MAG: hypothetical protein LBB23_02705 [Rickettsiales bacterium]|jgi:hypothetical protein|nr:hypothetical protein [Rickettsiales bacterium]